MVVLTATIQAVSQPAKVFIAFVEPGWPPYPVVALPAPSTPDLTDAYPLLTVATPLELVAAEDAVGNPGPENRMPEQMENRTDTLRANTVVLIRTMNLLPDRFVDRDGAQTPNEATGDMFMRGILNMGAFKIVNLKDGVALQDLVTQLQLQVVTFDFQDNVEQVSQFSVLRRDGTLAMQNPLSIDPNPALPTNRVINLGVPSATGLMMRKTDADTFETDFLQDYVDRLGTKIMTGDLNLTDGLNPPNRIVNVTDPTADGDGATKGYVDNLFLGGGGIGVPVGAVMAFMGNVLPVGWQLCDGREINRTTFSSLFAVIGTIYGSSGSTTFKLPDLRGRAIAGNDNLGGTSADRLTDLQADIIGGVLGLQNHALTEFELPSHTHGRPDSYFATGGAGALSGKTTPDTVSALVTTARVTGATGSGTAHNNVQPTLASVWIIRG